MRRVVPILGGATGRRSTCAPFRHRWVGVVPRFVEVAEREAASSFTYLALQDSTAGATVEWPFVQELRMERWRELPKLETNTFLDSVEDS